jgi:hypothetical protein
MNKTELTNMERHTQTALVLLLVGLLSWVGLTTHKTSIEIAKVGVELANLDVLVGYDHEIIEEMDKMLDIIQRDIVVLQENQARYIEERRAEIKGD